MLDRFRMLPLIGVIALLAACAGPPDPQLTADEEDEASFRDPRGQFDDDVGDIPEGL